MVTTVLSYRIPLKNIFLKTFIYPMSNIEPIFRWVMVAILLYIIIIMIVVHFKSLQMNGTKAEKIILSHPTPIV